MTTLKTLEPEAQTLNLYQKLASLSAEIGALEKDGTFTGQGGYKFISHASLMGALRAKLCAYGIWIKFETTATAESRVGDKGVRVTGMYRMTIINADNPKEREEIEWSGEGIDYGDKASQKAGTSAHKYALFKVFMVSDKDDNDAVPAHPEKETRVRGLTDARQQAPPTPIENLDDDEAVRLVELLHLAQALPRGKGAPSWFEGKLKARIRHHGGGEVGYQAVLKEVLQDHQNFCGVDCEHVAHPADMLAASHASD